MEKKDNYFKWLFSRPWYYGIVIIWRYLSYESYPDATNMFLLGGLLFDLFFIAVLISVVVGLKKLFKKAKDY